jgi:hypothetical protein
MTRSNVNKMIEAAGARADLPYPHPHMLRHIRWKVPGLDYAASCWPRMLPSRASLWMARFCDRLVVTIM